MNIKILFLLFVYINLYSQSLIKNSEYFQTSFIREKNYKIILPNNFSNDPDIVKMLKDKTLMLVNDRQILRCKLDGTILSNFRIKNNFSRINDVAMDSSNMYYVLYGHQNIVTKLDKNGNMLLKFKTINGQKLCIGNNKVLVLKTFFKPNIKWQKPIIFVYSLNGKFINSWGRKPKKPTVGLLPIVVGSLGYYSSIFLVSHGSDYLVEKYNQNGKLQYIYNKKPSFFNNLIELNGLNDKEIKKWYRTTLLMDVYFYVNDWIMMFFEKVDRTKSWICFQNHKELIEFSVPRNIYPIGTYKKNIFLIEQHEYNDSINKNAIFISKYVPKKKSFK